MYHGHIVARKGYNILITEIVPTAKGYCCQHGVLWNFCFHFELTILKLPVYGPHL